MGTIHDFSNVQLARAVEFFENCRPTLSKDMAIHFEIAETSIQEHLEECVSFFEPTKTGESMKCHNCDSPITLAAFNSGKHKYCFNCGAPIMNAPI